MIVPREDFPALARALDGRTITYLDNAATTLKPRAVIDALVAHYESNGASVHRGQHYLADEASSRYEETRSAVARFLGAASDEIVFVKNTTEALNGVASGLQLAPDSRIVGCLDSHHSQQLPWRRVGCLELVRTHRDGRVDLDHYAELLKSQPRVVALTHCSNVTGAIAPVDAMATMAKELCDATVVVDAAQSLPHQPLNVSRTAIDFVAFSGHKLLAPTGIGCLYGRRQALAGLRPWAVGGGTADWVGVAEVLERKIPHRLEAGTPPVAAVLGLGAALAYLDRFDATARAAHAHALTEALLSGALARDYLRLIGPTTSADRCAIATMRIPACAAIGDIARSLSDSYGIMCRTGRLCAQPIVDTLADGEVLRLSAYIYNSVAEIESTFSALDELVGLSC